MRRKIAVVTGSRSEYGILYEVMKEIQKNEKLELAVIASGMHLLTGFGKTVEYIEKDGFRVDAIVGMTSETDDSPSAMAQSIAKGIKGMVEAFQRIRPTAVIVLGDRTEALAAAIAATYMNIPVAHIHGGDNAKAGFDEMTRGAITKFSHIHFPATKKSADRIKKMGEAEWRINMVGSPAIDYLKTHTLPEKKELFKQYGLDEKKPVILVVQHPVTTESEKAEEQMEATLQALKTVDAQIVLIYPNADAGGRRMIETIKEYELEFPKLKTFQSIAHMDYLAFIKYARVMVGNSSSGIIEAPFFKTPVVNIGIRQEGRERAINVLDVNHDATEIVNAIKQAQSHAFQKEVKKCRNPYGNGTASKQIAQILATIEFSKKLLQKRMMEE